MDARLDTKILPEVSPSTRIARSIASWWQAFGPARRKRRVVSRNCTGYGLLLLTVGLLAGCGSTAIGQAEDAKLTIQRDVVFDPANGLKLDVFRPNDQATNRPIITFFFGGFWQFGGKDEIQNQMLAIRLARRGAIVILPDYRLYPAVRFPGFIEDGASAVAWARDHAAELGGSPDRIFVAGHSAGAYIAAMLATDGRYLAAHGMSNARLGGAIGLAGPYGSWFTTNVTLGSIFTQAMPAEVLPETFVSAGTPPMLLMSGGADMLTRPSDSQTLAEQVRRAGGQAEARIYPLIGHVGIMMLTPWLPSMAPVVDDMIRFVRAQSSTRLVVTAGQRPQTGAPAAPLSMPPARQQAAPLASAH
ncbi:alpha/beta hydrolase [Falsiroseomonas sp. E2-1-a20]|uniref:alpha/beta hydrolase n=1 Tax=Falsiroseomonas sp. E2-1-a20 TaxID=3239300 RepID=UPI003F377067